MRYKLTIIIIFALVSFNCGGGGGQYYPPKVAIDKINITKEEISNLQITYENKLSLKVNLDLEAENEKYFEGTKYYNFNEFSYNNQKYLLGIPIDKFISIINLDGNVVKKLSTPRYTIKAAAIELIGKNGNRFLSIYIQQQATSHSSTLYILNESFEIVYKEHLLGALWFAKESSKMGDNLIVAAEKEWIPNNKWISVGGPWRYIIFKKE